MSVYGDGVNLSLPAIEVLDTVSDTGINMGRRREFPCKQCQQRLSQQGLSHAMLTSRMQHVDTGSV